MCINITKILTHSEEKAGLVAHGKTRTPTRFIMVPFNRRARALLSCTIILCVTAFSRMPITPPPLHVDVVLPPQFTMFLKRDYARWAEGDDSRAAVASDGEALIAPEDG